jgi:hypothetical protein
MVFRVGGPSERAFETAICDSLLASGGYSTCKVGNAADRDDDVSPDLAIDTAELFAFIGATGRRRRMPSSSTGATAILATPSCGGRSSTSRSIPSRCS